MLINEVAKRCNITKKAVQYYVEQGLVVPRFLENGYKDFSEQDIKALKQIGLYRKLGLSVEEIKSVIENHDEVKHILYARMMGSMANKHSLRGADTMQHLIIAQFIFGWKQKRRIWLCRDCK